MQLNLQDATSAGLVSGTQTRELVLNSRNYEQLIQLQPGVVYGGATDQLYVGPTAPSGTYTGGPQNTYNLNADYGRAAIDRTNVITIDGIYELPFLREQKGVAGHLIGGWEVSGIYSINSGLPLTATFTSAGLGTPVYYGYTSALNGQPNGGMVVDSGGLGIAGNTMAGFRPNLIGNPNSGYGQQLHQRLQWFYRGAFAAAPQQTGRPGNEGRGQINGPASTVWMLVCFVTSACLIISPCSCGERRSTWSTILTFRR